jgi:hypothetical protein
MTLQLKPSSIVPTIGRKMWFFDTGSAKNERAQNGPAYYDDRVPFDATVIYVWGPSLVNLRVTDHAGNVFTRTSVPVADYDEGYEHGHQMVAAWMPYQSGQAKQQAAGNRPPDVPLTRTHDNGVPVDPAPSMEASD